MKPGGPACCRPGSQRVPDHVFDLCEWTCRAAGTARKVWERPSPRNAPMLHVMPLKRAESRRPGAIGAAPGVVRADGHAGRLLGAKDLRRDRVGQPVSVPEPRQFQRRRDMARGARIGNNGSSPLIYRYSGGGAAADTGTRRRGETATTTATAPAAAGPLNHSRASCATNGCIPVSIRGCGRSFCVLCVTAVESWLAQEGPLLGTQDSSYRGAGIPLPRRLRRYRPGRRPRRRPGGSRRGLGCR